MYFRTALCETLSVIIVAVLCVSLGSSRTLTGDSTPAGTLISNRAEASYEGEAGIRYDTVSETVTFTVLAVSTLTVSPKETAPSATVGPQEHATRVFRICNTGNVPNTY